MVDRMTVAKLLSDQGWDLRKVILTSGAYSVPDLNWVLNVFPQLFHRNLAAMGLGNYTEERTDCDWFGEGARFMARAMHGRTQHPTAMPCGLNLYPREETMIGHEINTWLVMDKGKLRIAHCEPQKKSRPEIKLTDWEREENQLLML